MASSVRWGDLLGVYQNATWLSDDEAEVTLATPGILSLFLSVEASDIAARDAQISALCDPSTLAVGQTIMAKVLAPRLGLGVLADTWQTFLGSPDARIKEPNAYYIKADGSHSTRPQATEQQNQYRQILLFVKLLEKAALYLDEKRQTLVFFNEGRLEIHIDYREDDFDIIDGSELNRLASLLDEDLHSDQRMAIFSDAVVTLVTTQSQGNRFRYLAQNIQELCGRIRAGYQLFASSFSYLRIRSEVEAAQSDYLSKIHKTFADIQGQLLGLPIATVVVATQLKPASACGLEAWANFAVACGAWLFSALLIGSCLNQWFTLVAIKRDIGRQHAKLTSEFKEISHQFSDIFETLQSRILWHQSVLALIVAVALAGGTFATLAYKAATHVQFVSSCIADRTPEPTFTLPGAKVRSAWDEVGTCIGDPALCRRRPE